MVGKLQITTEPVDGTPSDGGFFPKLAKARCEGFEGRFDASASGDVTLFNAALAGLASTKQECPSCAGPQGDLGDDPGDDPGELGCTPVGAK